MATAFRWGTLGLIRHLFESGTCTGLSDARLLERFVTHRDEAAFAALVARHGSLVLNTCQTVLKDLNAAEDAFQATFVLLFRKAGSIRGRDAVGAWLHRVAYRTALEARSAAARRRDIEQAAGLLRGVETRPPDDSAAVLHEEIERLPDRFRLPVVLCDLQGLTRDQAADHLGCTEGSLRNRLAKGRDLLRRRLTRRGITLAVPFVAPPGLPESLVATTLRAAAGEASDAVATLVTAASRGWILSRIAAAALVILALGTAVAIFGAGLAVPGGTQPTTTGRQAVQTPPARPQTAPSPPAADGPKTSQVKPAAPGTKPTPAVSSGPKPGQAKAAAPKIGPGVVEGRILNLEGRPIAGATVRVTNVMAVWAGQFEAFLDEVKRLGKRPDDFPYPIMPPERGFAAQGAGPSFLARLGLVKPPPTPTFKSTTGPDGRFRLEGLPPEGMAIALITGPGIESSEVYILTSDVPTIRVKDPILRDGSMLVYYGARFDHIVAAAHPIVGTVRDKDTGAPIPGVHITGMPNIPRNMIPSPGVEATTDAQGRYQVNGLSTSRGFKLFTEAPPGQPYVNGGFISPAGEAKPGPFTFDIALKRGVLVRGRLTNKATGKPVTGRVEYYAFQDNPHVDEYPNFKRESLITWSWIQAPDGRFTIPALPGRGLIAARTPEEGYLHSRGADAIKGFRVNPAVFATYPCQCEAIVKHVVVEINPAPGTKEMTVDLQVDPGRTVRGTMVGPDDRPVFGVVEIQTLDIFQNHHTPGDSSTFEVKGLPPGAHRLDFVHPVRKLAGTLRLKGDETGKLTVKLQPWGTVIGRILDEEGKPRTNVELRINSLRDPPDLEFGRIPDRRTVDAQGRFRIEGLIPGLKYDARGISSHRSDGTIFESLQVGPGEVKDVGDVTLPPRKWDGN